MYQEKDIQNIVDWLMAQAMSNFDLDNIFNEFSIKVNAMGLSLHRLNISLSILHPTMAAKSLTWRKDNGLITNDHEHSSANSDDWRKSPMSAILEGNIKEIHQSLHISNENFKYPILHQLKAEGATDYYLFPVMFDNADFHFNSKFYDNNRKDGMLISWVSDISGGFSNQDIKTIKRLTSRFAVLVKLWLREQISLNVVGAYMGKQVAEKILSGNIRRGEAELINTVIWYSDLRGSTNMADIMPVDYVMSALGDYFDCTAGAVIENNGQVLRFIGDAVLAIFPFKENDEIAKITAHKNAYNAAIEAFSHMEKINIIRKKQDLDMLYFGLSLHTGELLFGNIGVPERIEFSIIGGAANEAARIENMTKSLKKPALFTKQFIDNLPKIDWQCQGVHQLRGVKQKKHLFSSNDIK